VKRYLWVKADKKLMEKSNFTEYDKTESIMSRFSEVRKTTENLASPLEIEDYVIQATDDASPVKWHLGHTSWFFDKFIIREYMDNNSVKIEDVDFMFNSYYETLGKYLSKNKRGIMSRPLVKETYEYRDKVTQAIIELLKTNAGKKPEILKRVELGINHEQQHQELLLMDIKAASYHNGGRINYPAKKSKPSKRSPQEWVKFKGGIKEIGYSGNDFSFDNECPKHKVYLDDFELQKSPVSNGEFMEFIQADGYKKPELWLSEGWNFIQRENISLPLYWTKFSDGYKIFKMSGYEDIDMDEPVSHVSYFEADAFAKWKGARLPREEELEVAGLDLKIDDSQNFMEKFYLSPISYDDKSDDMQKLFGDVWEWTSSAYLPYHGGKPLEGNLGEYNFKFMSNQFVLRGGSCITPMTHFRKTYRNFYHPEKRWEMSGIRLARDSID
jgi:ergothioneine biosynthesis protein EgtB